ncbi:hypothetical protein DY000_02045374 [Brassica cretica]|uniref:Ubiquinol-cytochrome C reductase hinge domain-containing protein n=1 Tax=Brassica cretica TaxID=69181 RepID=A0ABQ7ENG1_BRACR|nr:hypothetical protein DY000_02045374 [Brassica cretica]
MSEEVFIYFGLKFYQRPVEKLNEMNLEPQEYVVITGNLGRFRGLNGLWAFKIGSLSPSGLDLRSRTGQILLSRSNFRFDFDVISLKTYRADEEVVDPKKYLEESCKPKCVKPLLEYQACVKRIQGDDSGHKHCTGQYFDYWHCIDKCVAPKLFAKLK